MIIFGQKWCRSWPSLLQDLALFFFIITPQEKKNNLGLLQFCNATCKSGDFFLFFFEVACFQVRERWEGIGDVSTHLQKQRSLILSAPPPTI